MTTSIYLTFTEPVNRKTWRYTASFLNLISKVEYVFRNLINWNMCLVISINKQLQTLERSSFIKKHHRIAYLDLLTYNDTFQPFTISKKLLKKILNLSLRALQETPLFLESVGLLKKSYITVNNGKRNIPNTLNIRLVHPQQIPPLPSISTNEAKDILARGLIDSNEEAEELLESQALSARTFYAKFVEIEKNVALLKDIRSQDFSIWQKYYWITLNDDNREFLESLYEGDHILFDAVPEPREGGKYPYFLARPTNIRSAYQ